MYRASEAIDLNPWSAQSQFGSHSSIQGLGSVGQPNIHGLPTGPSSLDLSRQAASRSALLQAVADRVPTRPAKAGKRQRSLLARLRQITLAKSPA